MHDALSETDCRLLQSMPIFGGISDSTLQFLLQNSQRQHLAAGDYFFHEGDRAALMFVLEAGEVSVLKLHDGHQHQLQRLNAGDCFGEMALIDLYPRSCSVRAECDCTAIEIGHAALFRLHTHDLEQFTIIQMNIAREISRRLRAAGELLFETGRLEHYNI